MNRYEDMNKQEKRSFKKVILICIVGAILILLIPIVIRSVL